MNRWNRIYKPIVVLVLVCIVVAGALAAANHVTEPVIEAATAERQDAARKELLPEADGFEPVENVETEQVLEIYKATNGVGVVVTGTAKGYGGDVTVMVAFADDAIKRIKVTQQTETKGIGSKVVESGTYWAQYEGLPAEPLTLGEDVDALTGATKSSRALLEAVNAAVEGYHEVVD